MQFRKRLMATCLVMIFISCSVSQKSRRNTAIVRPSSLVQNDTIKKVSKDSTKPVVLKPYNEVITANAITSKGMFTVHKLNERYFFEIPDSILNKDILVVSRIAQGAAGYKGGAGYAGDEIGESVLQFCKGPSNKIFIRLISFTNRSADSSANGMYRSLQASNLQPIQAAFDIKSIGQDSTTYVIDVTDFLTSDNSLLYFDENGKTALYLGGYQKDRSYIIGAKAFPLNVEIQTINTYLNKEQTKTFKLNVSFVLLPKQPMTTRYYDNRVGYFARGYYDYDAPEGVEPTQVITRWRLEPKDEDREKYLRGELVEPKTPIVYYIDPATPKKWVPYLIQGINDWQKAFEKAGFKKAIYALEAPTNDSTFSLLDARHSALIYKASPISNASGPEICDPRTGEILETHINWYHNVQQLLHDWYMIQAGPNDCAARKMVFDDELMGQLIRFVCCHEVGHTLGLRHNMGASSTVPTDSLRSKTYLDKNGFCPSIMDYARFNYVAQPEDGLTREELLPRIGVYDEWAIEWGYRWLPQLKTKVEEKISMDRWISFQLAKDKRLWWGEFEPGPFSSVTDPRAQTEDLGDDAMKASYYGIENLRKVMKHLGEWTKEPGKGYKDLSRVYKQVVDQYGLYVMHVANNIGNIYWTEKTPTQPGSLIQFIPKSIQKNAMHFLTKELFDTPSWLYNKDIFSLISLWGDYTYLIPQTKVIQWLVSYDNYINMSFAQMQQPNDAYSYDEFLTDLENEIWKELKTASPISFPRRNLQKMFTERMIEHALPVQINGSMNIQQKLQLDFYPLLQKHLRSIIARIDKQLPNYKDETNQLHLMEVKKRLQQALNFARFPQLNTLDATVTKPATNGYNLKTEENCNSFPEINLKRIPLQRPMKCDYWTNDDPEKNF